MARAIARNELKIAALAEQTRMKTETEKMSCVCVFNVHVRRKKRYGKRQRETSMRITLLLFYHCRCCVVSLRGLAYEMGAFEHFTWELIFGRIHMLHRRRLRCRSSTNTNCIVSAPSRKRRTNGAADVDDCLPYATLLFYMPRTPAPWYVQQREQIFHLTFIRCTARKKLTIYFSNFNQNKLNEIEIKLSEFSVQEFHVGWWQSAGRTTHKRNGHTNKHAHKQTHEFCLLLVHMEFHFVLSVVRTSRLAASFFLAVFSVFSSRLVSCLQTISLASFAYAINYNCFAACKRCSFIRKVSKTMPFA